MNKDNSLQSLLNNTATEEDIVLLKRLLARGEISISGNVNQSVIIIGSGNTVELPTEALDKLNARPMLGNLDRDLTGEEIASGLRRLEKLLPNRAPVLLPPFKAAAAWLRPTLKTDAKALSESARRERLEALASVNSICVEALDVSFNGLALGEAAPDYDARSPFRGLESFRPEDSEFFFGREALTQKLVGKIKAHSFLAVLGASGSGKSSLVMAGVIPALDSDYVIFRPGTRPLGELESARGKALIVVDQFEELFTLTRDESTREDFIAWLLDESSRAKIILTLRSDFLGDVSAYRTLSAEIQNHLEIVPPMDVDELRRAMEGQAGVTGLRFEADLSQQILDDVAGEPGAMPLLQHALWELWNRRHGRNLRASEYRAFGGVKQAITSTAEQIYADCSKPEQDALRDIFLRLTRLDDGDEGRDTRRRVPLGDLIPSGRDAASITLLLDKLANARLIVKTVNDDNTEVEVAHEALIRHWERLRIWLNEDRDNLRLRESVSEAAKEWEKSGRHESLLNSRWVKLDEALLLAQDSRYRLTEVEQAYSKGCVALRNREQRDRERRLRYTVFASVAAAVIFLVLGGFGLVKSNEAEKQANTALALQLAAQAHLININNSSKQLISSLLAVQSMKLNPNADAADFLINQNKSVKAISSVRQPTNEQSVAFSPDGKFILSVIGDNSIYVSDVLSGKEISHMTHNGTVCSVDFSPDGKSVVSGSEDGTARVWDALSGKELARMPHDGTVYSVDFSSDGKYVVTGSEDGTARVWDALSGKELARMPHDGTVYSVDFSSDGRYVASGSSDRTARMWDAHTGKEVARITHEGSVESVGFSPNGKYIVSGSVDGTVRVWDALSGKEVARMAHESSVYSVNFSPNGKYVVSGSMDGTARVWDAFSGKELARMTHQGWVMSVAFSPDGKYVVSGSIDHTARVWNALNGDEIARMNHDGWVASTAFSSDGNYIVSGSEDGFGQTYDGTVVVWKITSEKYLSRIIQDPGGTTIAVSPDGKYIASGNNDGTAHVWDALSGKEFARIDHDTSVESVTFSSDGKYLIVNIKGTSNDLLELLKGDDYLWDFRDGKEIFMGDIDPRAWGVEGGISSAAISLNRKYLVIGGNDHIARVLDVETGKEMAHIAHDSEIKRVEFSPTGKYVISISSDGAIYIWQANSGKILIKINININEVWSTSVVFNFDERYLALNASNGLSVWNLSTGKKQGDITLGGPNLSRAISPDGKYVAVGYGYEDGTARVWDVISGKEIARMTHGSNTVRGVVFSPDGSYIASVADDGVIRVWVYRSQDLINIACENVPRNLSYYEWNQYIGNVLPYQAVCPNLPIEP